MNPVTVGFLSQVERQQHARESRALQRLNVAAAHRAVQVPAHRRASRWVAYRLSRVLISAGRRLHAWSAAVDHQVPEPA